MTLNKILRFLILLGIFAVTLVPLYVASSMYFPFITGKNFLFRIVVEVMLGLWLILIYRDKTARPQKSWLLISLTTLLFFQIIATLFSQNPSRSFWSNFERMEGLVSYLHTYLFFIILVSVMKGKEVWHWLLNTTVVVSVITSLYGFSQVMGWAEIHQGSTRLDASLGNAAYLATYLLFHIFILSYLFFATSPKNKLLRLTYGIITLFELIILYFTATRGAILGLLGGLFLLLLLTAWKRTGRLRKFSLITLGSLIVFVVLFWSFRTTPLIAKNQVLGRFAEISISDISKQPRFMIWTMSVQGFKEHPVFGWGPENYSLVFQKYYNPAMYGQEPWFDRSHNVILDNLINFGLLGLLAYLSIFFTAIYYLWRKNERDDDQGWIGRIILTCLLAAYFFQNIFVFDNLTSVILFYLVLGYIHTVYGRTEKINNSKEPLGSKNKLSSELSDAYLPIVVIVAVAISASSLYYFSLRSISVSKTLIRAISQGTPETRLADFKKIFSYDLVTGQSEAREQLINATQGIIRNQSISNEIKQEYFLLTKDEMEKQFAIYPNDARSHLFYGSFLGDVGQKDEAIKELSLANQLSPKKQIIMFELGSLLLNAGQVERAVSLFKEAFEEDETYDEARKIYALVSLYTKDIGTAKKILGTDPDKYIKGDSRFDSFRSILAV